MPLKIITIEDHPDGALRKVAKEVCFPLSKEDRELIQNMKDQVHALGGVGLAANQVDILKRIAVIYIPKEAVQLRDNAQECPVYVVINPEYWPHGEAQEKDFEGCYSVKSLMGEVPRYCSVRVRYQKEDGSVVNKILSGLEARVFQHETDHLNGILFSDRFTPDCRRGDFATILKLRREGLSEEKRVIFDQMLVEKGIKIDNDSKK